MQVKLTKRAVDLAKPGTQDEFHWDVDMPGFGLKVTPKGRKVYVVQYRNGGRGTPTRRFAIGRHGAPWTVDEARKEARKIVGNVAHGGDPQSAKLEERAALTVSQLCDKYLSEGCGVWDQKGFHLGYGSRTHRAPHQTFVRAQAREGHNAK